MSELRLGTEGLLRIPLGRPWSLLPFTDVFFPEADWLTVGGEDCRNLVVGPFKPDALGIPWGNSCFSIVGEFTSLAFFVCIANLEGVPPGLFFNPGEFPGDDEFCEFWPGWRCPAELADVPAVPVFGEVDGVERAIFGDMLAGEDGPDEAGEVREGRFEGRLNPDVAADLGWTEDENVAVGVVGRLSPLGRFPLSSSFMLPLVTCPLTELLIPT